MSIRGGVFSCSPAFRFGSRPPTKSFCTTLAIIQIDLNLSSAVEIATTVPGVRRVECLHRTRLLTRVGQNPMRQKVPILVTK